MLRQNSLNCTRLPCLISKMIAIAKSPRGILRADFYQDYILVIMENFFALDFLLVTAYGSHFSNKMLKLLRKAFRHAQQFKVAIAPYTNASDKTWFKATIKHHV